MHQQLLEVLLVISVQPRQFSLPAIIQQVLKIGRPNDLMDA
jgi:hypothetical protein